MNPKNKVIIVLAYGDLFNDNGLSHMSPNADQDGAILRFLATLVQISPLGHISPRDINAVVVASAGYTRQSPSIPVPERRVSLAAQFYQWARQQESYWDKRIEPDGRYWGTRSEIWAGIELAKKHGASPTERVEIRVGTSDNWCHYFRVRLYVWLYKPRKWKMKVFRSKHRLTFSEKIAEVVKVVDGIISLLLHPLGIRRIRT